MPQLHYAITKTEMIVPAVAGLGHTDATARVQAGQPLPRPLHVRAVVDTGCSTTAVAPAILGQLGLTPLLAGSSQTASSSVAVNLYLISLSIFDASRGPPLTLRDLLVSELTTTIPQIDMLIGMDVLLDCKLLLDGPARRFTLEF
jgi:hypothetical protein